jgi:hypothetical protein
LTINSKNNNKGGIPLKTDASVAKTGCETIQIKNVRTNVLSYTLKRAKNLSAFLKKVALAITHFLYRSRKTVLLVVAVVLVTLISSFLIASWWFSSSDYAPNGDYDRTVSTTGTIKVQGLEIYGGDIKTEGENVYVDWGELTLGASKKASFYVKSTSNVDVELGLNVTNWMPTGIEDYVTISWDYNGTVLSPTTPAILASVNLEVASDGHFIDFLVENEVTTFGFDITIYASGVQ